MNLITIIDGLAPYQFVRAEELSESVIQSDSVGAEWLVPDSGEEVPLHVFLWSVVLACTVRSVMVSIRRRSVCTRRRPF